MSDCNVLDQPTDPLNALATTILKESSTSRHESIRALWRIGDGILAARTSAPAGKWRNALAQVASKTGVHPGFLDDAARAAAAFPTNGREAFLSCFEQSSTQLTRSHVVTLSRMTPGRRTRVIQAMLRSPCSVADLRLL